MRSVLACALSFVVASSVRSEPAQKKDLPGLHNVLRVTDKLWSGGSPEKDAGFESLRRLGIRTIISVDGARPDLERARKFGMRYVHLPIGYSGLTEAQALRIVRAIRDLPGPVFIHCHHGKHRGPAAAALAMRCLDERCSVESAIAFMEKAGTDKRYAGLYESVRRMKRVSSSDLERVPADFPEWTQVSDLAQAMVEIDEHWNSLKLARQAGWKPPAEHPDIDPAREAGILAQRYRAAAKAASANKELSRWLVEATEHATSMERSLQSFKMGADATPRELERTWQRMGSDCTRCHGKFRDR